MSSHVDNKKVVKDFFADIFSSPPTRGVDHTAARATIAKIRKKSVPEHFAKVLDQPLSEEELRDAISTMKSGKTPGQDGIPNEFYLVYKDLLVPYLLAIWREALAVGALPTSINIGIIKLIHKRGSKEELGNWRPITCL